MAFKLNVYQVRDGSSMWLNTKLLCLVAITTFWKWSLIFRKKGTTQVYLVKEVGQVLGQPGEELSPGIG